MLGHTCVMTQERPDGPSGMVLGPAVREGEAPWYVPWVYFVPMLAGALWMGFAGPFSGWEAVLAALVTAAAMYVVVTAFVIVSGLTHAYVSARRDRRAFERDPQAFFAKRFPKSGPGSDH